MEQVRIAIEKREIGCVACPAVIRGIVLGEGNTVEDALRNVHSALSRHPDRLA